MVVTGDDGLAEKIRIMRSHGMTTLTWDRYRGHSFSYDVVARGYNYRIDEMRAALGTVQLERLERGNALRWDLIRSYREQLSSPGFLELPFLEAAPGSAHHLFPILLKEGLDRPAFMQTLARQGIQTSIHYPPVHHFSHYRQVLDEDEPHLPRTDDAASREVSLPLFAGMSHEQLEIVAGAVQSLVC
jgi:dTDP-4-amino-4,6-dideoxygalactose transaminase